MFNTMNLNSYNFYYGFPEKNSLLKSQLFQTVLKAQKLIPLVTCSSWSIKSIFRRAMTRNPNTLIQVTQPFLEELRNEYGDLVFSLGVEQTKIPKSKLRFLTLTSSLHDLLIKSCSDALVTLNSQIAHRIEESLYDSTDYFVKNSRPNFSKLVAFVSNPKQAYPAISKGEFVLMNDGEKRPINWDKVTLALTKIQVTSSNNKTISPLSLCEAKAISSIAHAYLTDTSHYPPTKDAHTITSSGLLMLIAIILSTLGIIPLSPTRGFAPTPPHFKFKERLSAPALQHKLPCLISIQDQKAMIRDPDKVGEVATFAFT